MTHPSCFTILVIEDCAEHREAYCHFLQQDSRYTYRIVQVESATQAIKWCQQEIPDIILLDFVLPDGDGLKFLEQFRECHPHSQTAVIMLTGRGDEATAVRAMKSGVDDYLVKDKLTIEVLLGAIHHALERMQLTRQLAQSREQQQLIAAIALRIRQSLKLEEILHTTATEVRQFLKADRVLVYQFQPDMSGIIVAESVLPSWTVALGKQIRDTCFQQRVRSDYHQGKKRAIDDIYQAGLTKCHLQVLEQFQVKANLVVPILVNEQLWGLLIAHQCSASRHWQSAELDLLDQLAVQIAIAIQQASAYEQLQTELAQRQRTEAALKASEEKLKLTLNFAGIGYWEWNPSTNEIFGSQSTIHGFYSQPSDVILTVEQWLSRIHPEDRQSVEEELKQAIASQTDYAVEYRVIWQDSSIHWVSVKGRGIYDATGQLLRMLGVVMDITERKLAEQERQRTEILQIELDLLEKILEVGLAGYWDWDIPGNQEYLSPTLKQMFGYEDHELPNTPESRQSLIFPEDLPGVLELFERHVQSRGQVPYYNEVRYRHKNGSTVWVICSGRVIAWDQNGNPLRMIGCHIDITKRKQTEAQLHKNATHLANAQRIANLGSWEFDLNTQEIIWSQQVFRIFGRNPESGTPTYDELLQWFHPSDRARNDFMVKRAITQGQPYEEEYRFYLPDQSLCYVLAHGELILDADGKPQRLVGTILDITKRKQIEEALRQSEHRYATLAKAAPVGIFRLDMTGNCLYVNAHWSDLTGRPTQAALGQGWLEAVHPEDRDRILREWQEAMFDSTAIFCNEGRHLRPDGSINWFYCSVLPETNVNGQVLGYIGTLTDITSRKQAEQQLLHFSERLTLALSSGNFGIWEYDFAQAKQIWDDRMYELYGMSKADFPGTYNAWWNCLHPDDRDYMMTSLERVIEGKQEYNVEFRIIQPSGKIMYLKGYGILNRNQQGEPVRIIGVNFDITERKQAEQELIRNRDLREAIFNESADAIFLVDPQTLLTLDCNRRAVELFEATDKTQLIDIDGGMLQLRPFTASETDAIVAEMRSNGVWSREIEYVTLKGNIFWGNIAAKPIIIAGSTKHLVRISDISDRKQSQQALAKYAHEVEDLYNHAPCGYHSVDNEGRLIKVNETELQWLGYKREEMIGQPLANFFTPASRLTFAQNYSRFKQQGWVKDLEYEMVSKDGTVLPVLINATAVKDADGNYLHSRTTLFDMRERKQVEEKLRQTNRQLVNTNIELARATRLKDEFLANMSHELRTPLNAILGMSEGLQEAVFGSINERQIKAISTIERSGRHLLELINDILDLSKIESGKLELQLADVSVKSLCDASLAFIKQMALKKNIRLNTHIAHNIRSIQADDRRLRQVLINLLSNAVKFTPEGGSVKLEVRVEEAGEQGCRGAGEVNSALSSSSFNLCFQITDTGIGIAAEDIGKLFQPFIQLDSSLNRQYSGTGLGLALVKRIVNLHGGTVSVTSEVGQGSCFHVCIPYVNSDHVPASQVTPLLPSYDFKTKNAPVLIIEDSVPASDQITRYLNEMGMQPVVYPRGEGALEQVLNLQPSVIILDLQLPNLSGWELLHQFKTNPQTQNIPVIIISVVDERTKGLAQGASEYLVKPITRTQLQATIEKLQHSARSEPQNPILVPEVALNHPLILIAEDNQANIDTMSGYLESRGYDLILANNGQQAIDIALAQCPELIVMDIQMPGMDGLEAIRRLRHHQQFFHTPIIALTALAMTGDREACLAAGANEYLTKPVKLKQLVTTIQQLLGR